MFLYNLLKTPQHTLPLQTIIVSSSLILSYNRLWFIHLLVLLFTLIMSTAKYYVQQRPKQPLLDGESSDSKSYFIVFGLALGSVLAVTGGAMCYLAFFGDSSGISVADFAYVPTKIISFVLMGFGGILALSSLLICACFGFAPASYSAA